MKRRSLLGYVDTHHPDNLPNWAAGEVYELQEAIALGLPLRDQLDEAYDVLVFLLSWIDATNHQLSWRSINPASVNGFGSQSSAFEKLHETVLDVLDQPSAIIEALRRYLSILKHFFPFAVHELPNFSGTIKKVLDNRPLTLYSVYYPYLGENLDPDGAHLKYDHLEKVTRSLRNHVKRTLQPPDWNYMIPFLIYWQESEEVLSTLRAHLSGSVPRSDIIKLAQNLEQRYGEGA